MKCFANFERRDERTSGNCEGTFHYELSLVGLRLGGLRTRSLGYLQLYGYEPVPMPSGFRTGSFSLREITIVAFTR